MSLPLILGGITGMSTVIAAAQFDLPDVTAFSLGAGVMILTMIIGKAAFNRKTGDSSGE